MNMKNSSIKNRNPVGKIYRSPKRLVEELKKFDLSIEDLVILLLGVTEDNAPVYGRTLLVKEIFLTIQEVLTKHSIKFQDPVFVPYKYGPYSFNLIDAVESMAMRGYIVRKGKRGTRKEMFCLTDKGREVYKKLKDKISKRYPEFLKDLKEKRIGWDELGTEGILRYVYQKYPNYTERSKILEKYKPIQWGQGRG